MQTSTASARQLSYRHPKATTNSRTNPARNPYILAETPWRKHAAQEAGWTGAACVFRALSSHSAEVSDSVFNSRYFQELLRTCQGTGNTLKHIPRILLNVVSVAFSWILCCLLLQASFRCSSVSYTVNRVSLKQNGRYNCLKCCKPIHFNMARLSGKYVNLCWLLLCKTCLFTSSSRIFLTSLKKVNRIISLKLQSLLYRKERRHLHLFSERQQPMAPLQHQGKETRKNDGYVCSLVLKSTSDQTSEKMQQAVSSDSLQDLVEGQIIHAGSKHRIIKVGKDLHVHQVQLLPTTTITTKPCP